MSEKRFYKTWVNHSILNQQQESINLYFYYQAKLLAQTQQTTSDTKKIGQLFPGQDEFSILGNWLSSTWRDLRLLKLNQLQIKAFILGVSIFQKI